MSIKTIKDKTKQAKEIQDKVRLGEKLPTVKANIETDRDILEHEDHLVHFDFIHHNFDQVSGKEKGVWTRGQKCYPRQWPKLEKSLEGQATEVILVHDPNKSEVKGDKKVNLTEKQQAQKDFTELFGYEPDDSITKAQLTESIGAMKDIDEAFGALADEGVKIERPVTLEDAKKQLEDLQASQN